MNGSNSEFFWPGAVFGAFSPVVALNRSKRTSFGNALYAAETAGMFL
jgi:hypothetical protein